MSILDNDLIENTDELFLLGRWLPLAPNSVDFEFVNTHLAQPTTLQDSRPLEVRADHFLVSAHYANKVCKYMFAGRMSLVDLWELIGGIEVDPDWVTNWTFAAHLRDQDELYRYNEVINDRLVQSIADELVKRFAANHMHIMTQEEFDSIHLWSPLNHYDEWFRYEPGILLRADWYESPAYLKIMMTSHGIGFGFLYECADATLDASKKDNIPFQDGPWCCSGNPWGYDLFVLDLSPDKNLLDHPRDINEFMRTPAWVKQQMLEKKI